MIKRVSICQGRTCSKYGSSKVLAAFQANPVPDIEIVGCSCLGQCGNGPMVVVEPEQVWYWRVYPDEVAIIVEQHLRNQHPVQVMLYQKFHSDPILN